MLKPSEMDIDRSCHVLYSRPAQKAICTLLKKHYPDTWDAVFEQIQRQYVQYLKGYRRDLGGRRNFHNGVGGTYDCIFYFCLWEQCKGQISFEEVEKSYADLVLPTFAGLKLLNGNHGIVKRLMHLAMVRAEKRCGAFGDFQMHVPPYDKRRPLTYSFTACPVAAFAREHGFTDILPALCNADYACMEQMHVKLIRKKTLGFADVCDYMMVGDRDPLVKAHPQYVDGKGYIRNK